MAQEGPIASAAPPANTVGTTQIIDGQVALVDMANLATDRLIGRDTAGTGVPEALTVGGGVEFTGSGGIQRSALTGVVTAAAGSGTTTIATAGVTSAMLRDSAAVSVIGRSANSVGVPADIAAGSDGDILRRAAGAVGFGTVPSTSVTGLGTAAAADTGTGAANVPTITQADARYQPLDADLTALAAVTVTAAGTAMVSAANAAAQLALVGGAPLASPTFTGTPAAPTAAGGTNTTQIATTAFVTTAVAASVKRYQVPVTWFQDNVTRTQTDVVLAYRTGATQWRAPAACTIKRVTTHFNDTITNDTLTIDVFVNGVTASVDMVHSSGAFPTGGTQACSVALAAGDLVTITISTDAALNPHITPDINVWLTVEETA